METNRSSSLRKSSGGASRTSSSSSSLFGGSKSTSATTAVDQHGQADASSSEGTTAPSRTLETGSVDDYEDYDIPKSALAKHWSRVTALFLGIAVLASIAIGLYYFMESKDVNISKSETAGSTIREEELSEISLFELEQHNAPDDCWLAIHGFVWDLTKYGAWPLFRRQVV